jgi:hypothetical protein
MGMPENGSLTRCASVSYPKTSPLQTGQGKFVTAPNSHLKKHRKQEPLWVIPLDEYELMTSAQKFAFEKAIEEEQRWSKLYLDVCHVCDGCRLTKMSRTMVEFGHTTKREQKPICGICAQKPTRNTTQNWVIPYWLDRHVTIHTNVPREFNDLTFAEMQLIAFVSICVPVGMVISTKAEKLMLDSRVGLDNSCSWLMAGLRRIRHGASMP